MEILIPPIKCQGIKSKLVKWIDETRQWDNTGVWIEPFMGSGVVGFNLKPRKALFSDTNPHLISFYQGTALTQTSDKPFSPNVKQLT